MKALLIAAALVFALFMSSAQAAPLRGDVSGDGRVDVVDALFVLQYTRSMREFTPAQLRACDMGKDKKCTRADAEALLRYDVGLDYRAYGKADQW